MPTKKIFKQQMYERHCGGNHLKERIMKAMEILTHCIVLTFLEIGF
jgi:hypothetical protein